ncbi:hypothetical protein RDI58_024485 [Solanum bulbocastanum]|uniref:Uncharacterized protein n=1 Tax=Solanum bulbocastanum TaxID=147425 RepID=A0AAN8T368_SOLBU
MHHGDPKFGQKTSALFYHIAIGVIVDGTSFTHDHQCFIRVYLDNDFLQVEVLHQGRPAMYSPQFRCEARRCSHT